MATSLLRPLQGKSDYTTGETGAYRGITGQDKGTREGTLGGLYCT